MALSESEELEMLRLRKQKAMAGSETPAASSSAPKKQTPTPPSEDSAYGFITGNLNKGIAGLAGLPVDTAANILDLGKAGAGYVASKFNQGQVPGELQVNQDRSQVPGSSQQIEGMMKRGGMVTPAADPQSGGGRYAAAALQMIPGALMSPGTAGQLPAKALAGVSSGIGSEVARDIGGDEWAAVGAMAPAAGRLMAPPSVSTRATAGRKAEAFAKAREMGIPVSPSEMKVDKIQQALQDRANSVLRQPAGAEITPETMATYRSGYSTPYTSAFDHPALKNGIAPTRKFRAEIRSLGDNIDQMATEMPETFKSMKPVLRLLNEYGYGATVPSAIDPKIAMRALKKLRAHSTKNFQSDDPAKVDLARAQRTIATSLEDLVEENLVASKAPGATEAMQSFREARTAMAKSYDIEASLDPVTRQISGARLSQLLTAGRPMTGGLREMAEVSGQFPGSTRSPAHEELFTHRVTPMAVTHPEAMAAHWSTRMWNPITKSRPYQSMLVDPTKRLTPEQQQLLRFTAAAQATNRQPPGSDQ